ncbi:MAG: polyprenyl synthetase family protein [Kouleothrix sp.]|jgi:geranylgeranyl diphosphate synthase type I|nr:polyprenyl synthetase family protein [Kouleothrix sp.]
MTQTDIRTQIQAAMRAAFPAAEARVARFYAMQEYQLGWRDERLGVASYDPGKLIRPALTLLACRAAGGDPRTALPLAAGIQLIHDFSLIHDDIEDNSDTRRSRPTVWKVWGLAQGINTGDGMYTIAHLALHQLRDAGVPAERTLEIIRRFDQTILRICEGQFLDLSFEGDLTIAAADYLAMISRKTAALIAAAAGLGALVGGADATSAGAMFEYGESLGLAFQIQDDVLGIWGDPEVTGKPFAADLYRRKLSLPIIHALTADGPHGQLAQLYGQPEVGDADVRRILAILDRADARGYTEGVAAHYHQRALAALDATRGDAAAINEIRAITERLLGRRS